MCVCVPCNLYFVLFLKTNNYLLKQEQKDQRIFPSLSRSLFRLGLSWLCKFDIKISGIISRLLGPASAADPYGATTTLGGLTNGNAAAAAAAAAVAYGAAQPLNANALQAAAAGVAGKQIEGKKKTIAYF